ncbi:MAG: hypothetical protein OXI87_14255 [Albidovulum sp.]|nr:hypothetical protein [Albidovulum sp.]
MKFRRNAERLRLRRVGHAARSDTENCSGREISVERGATLLEAALAATLFGSFIVLANHMVSEEIQRKRAVVLGRDLKLLTLAAQSYVSSEYELIRQRLLAAPDRDAASSIELADLVPSGHLPSPFASGGGHVNSFGQSYRLLVRGVNRSDASVPQATLTGADLDADDNGAIDGEWVDGDLSNGEFELEAVLASYGGSEIPPTRGNPAIVSSELATAGFVQEDGIARGPYGNWSLDIGEFSDLEGFPEKGRFASLVALSRYGVLNFPMSVSARPESGYPFERCYGLDESDAAFGDCKTGNRIFAEAVFKAHDSDGDGELDRFGTIRDLHYLAMAPAADAGSDGILDVFPAITGVLELACGGGGEVPATGTLLLDCPRVRLSGSADLDGELAVGGGIRATGSVGAERFTASALGGADLTKGVYTVELVSMEASPEVAKPECADAGSNPEVFVAPASFASPEGAPLVGIAGFAADSTSDASKWTIGMEAVIDRDSDGDGLADVIALAGAHDLALVLGRCS